MSRSRQKAAGAVSAAVQDFGCLLAKLKKPLAGFLGQVILSHRMIPNCFYSGVINDINLWRVDLAQFSFYLGERLGKG
jgi:hypothetical protein